MEPFYDENYYYDNFNPQYNQMCPPYPITRRQINRANLQKTIRYASKTIYTINQILPLIHQLRPLINNTRNAFKIIQAVNHLNDLDLDEVEQNITPIEQKNESHQPTNDVTFENMIQ